MHLTVISVLVIVFGLPNVIGKPFVCYSDLCNSGGVKDQFCSETFGMCRNCADVRDDCGTTNQPLSCTPYCINYAVEQTKQKERDKPCPSLPAIPNGNHTGNEVSVHSQGDVVHASCHDGYRLKGWEETTCDTWGHWSRPLPTCVEITCSSPFQIANGQFQYMNGAFLSTPSEDKANVVTSLGPESTLPVHYNTSVIYSCKPGYSLKGPAVWTCEDDGQWDQNMMVSCHFIPVPPEVICPPPLQLTNGELRYMLNQHPNAPSEKKPQQSMMPLANDTYFPSTISIMYNCSEGYRLKGPSVWTCGEDGRWDQDNMVSCELDVVPSGAWYNTVPGIAVIIIGVVLMIGIVITCVLVHKHRKKRDTKQDAKQKTDHCTVVDIECSQPEPNNIVQRHLENSVTNMNEHGTAAEKTEVNLTHRAGPMPSNEKEKSNVAEEESDTGSVSSRNGDGDDDDHNQSKDSGIESIRSAGKHHPAVSVTTNINICNENSIHITNSNCEKCNKRGHVNGNDGGDSNDGSKHCRCGGINTGITTSAVEETSKGHRREGLPTQEHGKDSIYSQETGHDELCRPERQDNHETSMDGPIAINGACQ